MASIIINMLIMFALIVKNKIVYKGAYDGLMLWFNNVIPLLLPFMLMSGLIVKEIKKIPFNKQKKHAVIITLFTGLLCGYPLGAKNAAEFVSCGSYNTKTGNRLLPICNNISPMFLSGYILLNVLNERVTFIRAILIIYSPYVLYIFISFIFDKLTTDKGKNTSNKSTINPTNSSYNSESDYIMSVIIQITYVGFYIIICSIISEFIMSLSVAAKIKTLFAGISEITKGTMLIKTSPSYNLKIKTALILSFCSFGGVSSILQTKKVIKDSGLSIIKYIIAKTICAFASYGLAYFLI